MKNEFIPYREYDYEDLIEMVLRLYREDPEGELMNEEKIRRTIEETKVHPDKVGIYMFKNQRENIGYAILVHCWSNEYGGNIVNIDELYVTEAYRSKGVATGFIEFAGRLEKTVALQLEVTPSNQRALTYYERMGFAPSANTHLLRPHLTQI